MTTNYTFLCSTHREYVKCQTPCGRADGQSPRIEFVAFSLEMWHLVAIILMHFMIINFLYWLVDPWLHTHTHTHRERERERESQFNTAGGSEFHVRGAAVLNDRLANDVRRNSTRCIVGRMTIEWCVRWCTRGVLAQILRGWGLRSIYTGWPPKK